MAKMRCLRDGLPAGWQLFQAAAEKVHCPYVGPNSLDSRRRFTDGAAVHLGEAEPFFLGARAIFEATQSTPFLAFWRMTPAPPWSAISS
jgi:hypothetical protein